MRIISNMLLLVLLANVHFLNGQTISNAVYQERQFDEDGFSNRYYVSAVIGKADGDGSRDNPWDALTDIDGYAFSPGDTVFFERGSKWTGTFEITASGSPDSPIVFTSYGEGAKPAISNPDPSANDGNAIRISANYVLIDDFYIHDCGFTKPRTVAGIASFNREDHHITIQNSEFSGCRVGVRLYAHDVLITNNHMHSPGGGINEWWGPMGIVGVGYNGEISFNVIEGFLAPNNYGYDGGAIELDDEGIHTNWKIHHNISLGNEGFLETYDDSECEGCTWGDIEICYNYSDDYQWFLDGPIGDNPVIENNTIIRVLPANTDFNWCISLHHLIPKASVRNNIFVLANGVKAFEWENPGSSTSDNIYFSVDGSRANPKGYVLRSGEIIADPLFVDYELRDLHVLPGSPAIDMAESSRYTFDLDRSPVPHGIAPDAGAYEFDGVVSIPEKKKMPETFLLNQNYPNPFKSRTIIRYQIPSVSYVELSIYNLSGTKVATLVNERQDADSYEIEWNAKGMNPGIYLCELRSSQGRQITKINVIKMFFIDSEKQCCLRRWISFSRPSFPLPPVPGRG